VVDLGISVVAVAELVHGAYRAQTSPKHGGSSSSETLCGIPCTMTLGMRGWSASWRVNWLGRCFRAFEDLAIGATALALGFDVATANVRTSNRFRPEGFGGVARALPADRCAHQAARCNCRENYPVHVGRKRSQLRGWLQCFGAAMLSQSGSELGHAVRLL